MQKEGDLNEAVEQHQWCRLFFHKIGNLNAACAPSFKYTDVVGKIFKKSGLFLKELARKKFQKGL